MKQKELLLVNIYLKFTERKFFISKEISKFGIGIRANNVFNRIYKNDGISQEELSEILNIDKQLLVEL